MNTKVAFLLISILLVVKLCNARSISGNLSEESGEVSDTSTTTTKVPEDSKSSEESSSSSEESSELNDEFYKIYEDIRNDYSTYMQDILAKSKNISEKLLKHAEIAKNNENIEELLQPFRDYSAKSQVFQDYKTDHELLMDFVNLTNKYTKAVLQRLERPVQIDELLMNILLEYCGYTDLSNYSTDKITELRTKWRKQFDDYLPTLHKELNGSEKKLMKWLKAHEDNTTHTIYFGIDDINDFLAKFSKQ